jgi:hypothetical protein
MLGVDAVTAAAAVERVARVVNEEETRLACSASAFTI